MRAAFTPKPGRGSVLACLLVLLLASCQSPLADPKADLRRQRDLAQARLSQPAEADEDDGFALASLDRQLGEEAHTLAFYDTLSADNAARIFIARQLVRELVVRQRYADALLGWDARYVNRYFNTSDKTSPRHALLRFLDYYEAVVAAGDPAEAQALAGRIGEFDRSPEALALLRARAARAGRPGLPQTQRRGGAEVVVRPVSRLTQFRQSMARPDFRQKTLAEARSRLGEWYGFLFQQLRLPPDKLGRFQDLLIERAAVRFDLTVDSSPRGRARISDPAARDQAIQDGAGAVDVKIRDVLGEDDFLRYQDYASKLSRWLTAGMLETALRPSLTPLTPGQAVQLVEAYRGFTPGDLAGRQLGLEQMAGAEVLPYPQPADADVRERAVSILSPPQLAALRRLGQQIEIKWDEEDRLDPIDPGAPAPAPPPAAAFELQGLDRAPVPIAQPAPAFPANLRQTGVTGKAVIDFLVFPDGAVHEAKILEATQPDFGASALAAVRQWTFQPAERQGKPVIAHMAVPVIFQLDPEQVAQEIRFLIGPPQRIVPFNGGGGLRRVQFTVTASGSAAGDVRAARVFVTRAEDNTGAALRQGETPQFFHVSAGRVSDDPLYSSRQPIQFSVEGIAPGATALHVLEARVEVFVPLLDPAASAEVARLPSHFGVPLASPSLTKAGFTLVVFDHASAQRQAAAKTAGGPQDYDSSLMFGADYLDPAQPAGLARQLRDQRRASLDAFGPQVRATMIQADTMGENDLAVGLRDPEHRVIGLEFQNADGSAIRYNHNGRYHTERTSEGKRFDVYGLDAPLPADARLVCWIQTPDAVISSDFKLADIPLPSP